MAPDEPIRNVFRPLKFIDQGKGWGLQLGGYLRVSDNLTVGEVEAIAASEKLVVISFVRRFPISTDTLCLINDGILPQHPHASMAVVLNGTGPFDDLAFLSHLPRLRSLGVEGAIDLDPIRYLQDLEELTVQGRNASLRPLQGRERLKVLSIAERIKHHEMIGTCLNLEKLEINGQGLNSLAFLANLNRLRTLSFILGGTRRFEDLPKLQALEELSIWRPRLLEMDDLLPLTQISRLRSLVLNELQCVTSLSWLTNANIQLLELEDMRGLHSYTSLGGLTGLETLIVRQEFSAEHIGQLACLGRLKTLYLYGDFVEVARRAAQAKALGFTIKDITFRSGERPPSEIG